VKLLACSPRQETLRWLKFQIKAKFLKQKIYGNTTLVQITHHISPNYTDHPQVNIHWIHCIGNFFTVQDFWTTCACPDIFKPGWTAAPHLVRLKLQYFARIVAAHGLHLQVPLSACCCFETMFLSGCHARATTQDGWTERRSWEVNCVTRSSETSALYAEERTEDDGDGRGWERMPDPHADGSCD